MKTSFGILIFSVLSLCGYCQGSASENETAYKFNKIKLNLTAIPLNNYALQYERVLSKKSSVALSFRLMPESKIPFQSKIKEMVADEDASIQKTVDQLRISNFAVTPEYRFYFGKGHGRGFYIAPFYRYATFESNNIVIAYTADLLNTQETITLSGELSSNTGGVLFGAQWNLSRSVTLDWMIVGPHFGAGDGLFTGLSSRTLSPSEQQRVREELEGFDIPFTDKTVNVNAQGASLLLDGPWGGIRSGISLGINF